MHQLIALKILKNVSSRIATLHHCDVSGFPPVLLSVNVIVKGALPEVLVAVNAATGV
jgi:hypothetical protein